MNIISTDKAPAAIGPYSQAIEAGGTIYVSGQIPVDPATGEIVDGDIKVRTRRCMDNISAILAAAGTDLTHVVRMGVYLTDMGDFAAMNEAYAQALGDTKPARSCVQVAALPKGVNIEIEAIAIR